MWLCHPFCHDNHKKSSLLFDYACHSCSETMLIFSVYLSVCLMPDHEGRANSKCALLVYKDQKFILVYDRSSDCTQFILYDKMFVPKNYNLLQLAWNKARVKVS